MIMCLEVVWWCCYWCIVFDYLIVCGEMVLYIMDCNCVEFVWFMVGVVIWDDGMIVYLDVECNDLVLYL